MARMLWPGCAYLSSSFLVMAVGCPESATPAKISQPERRSSEKQTRSSREQALSSAEQNSEAAGPIKVEFFTESGRIPLLSIGDLRLRMTNRSANSVVIERVWPTPQWLEIRDASGQEVPSEI